MNEELNKEKVKEDLERWGKKIIEIDKMLREMYEEMNKIYILVDR